MYYSKYIMNSVLIFLFLIALFLLLRLLEYAILILLIPISILAIAFFIKMQVVRGNTEKYKDTHYSDIQIALCKEMERRKNDKNTKQ